MGQEEEKHHILTHEEGVLEVVEGGVAAGAEVGERDGIAGKKRRMHFMVLPSGDSHPYAANSNAVLVIDPASGDADLSKSLI